MTNSKKSINLKKYKKRTFKKTKKNNKRKLNKRKLNKSKNNSIKLNINKNKQKAGYNQYYTHYQSRDTRDQTYNKCSNSDPKSLFGDKYKEKSQKNCNYGTKTYHQCEDYNRKMRIENEKRALLLAYKHIKSAGDLGGVFSSPNINSIKKLACIFKLIENKGIRIDLNDKNIRLCHKLIVENDYEQFIDYIKGNPKHYQKLLSNTIIEIKNTISKKK